MKDKGNAVLTWAMVVLALVLFTPLFAYRTAGPLDFWWWMSINAALLTTLSAILDPRWRAGIREDLERRRLYKIGLGLVSAAVLYAVFYAGNFLSRVLLPFAGGRIEDVYLLKSGAPVARITLLLLLVIGPGEELFWRAFVQRRLQGRYGAWKGVLLATLFYTAMHLGSLNPILIMAALIAGMFWGLTYLRYRSIMLNVVSHTAWDLAVFLAFPFL